MVLIGPEVFDLLDYIIVQSKEQLDENELFLKYCNHHLNGEIFVIKCNDVCPYNEIDWFCMSFERFDNFKIDQMNNIVIFENIEKLMYGLKELYTYIADNYSYIDINRHKAVVDQSISSIDKYFEIENMSDSLDNMYL